MNDTVFEYCEKFIKAKKSPRFAVLIKGEWGVGKTFFIKQLIQTLHLEAKDYVYLSLFGLKSVDDINMKIFEAMHPILSSTQMKLLGSAVKSALKIGADFKVELPVVNKKINAKIETGDLSLGQFGKIQTKRSLIVVDDIERLGENLSINDVFGFFQDLIVDSDTKIIFIGNEDKIVNAQSYAVIKEKTIGQEFLIHPNPYDAIHTFVEELSINKTIKDIVKKCAEKIVSDLNCQNLRCVRSALWNLNEHSDFIIKDLYDVDRERFISTYILLFIQKSLNQIERSDISRALRIYEKYHIGYKDYKKQGNDDFIDFLIINIPVFNLWDQIIFDGLTSRDSLFATYKMECETRSPKEPLLLFKVVNFWRDYDETQFKDFVDQLVKEVDEGKYLHPGALLHYANIMLLFSSWGLRSEKYRFIENQIKKVYSKYDVIALSDFDGVKTGCAGLSYSTNFEPFEKIKDVVEKYNYINLTKKLSEQVVIDVKSLENKNVNEFCCNLLMCNGTDKYRSFPFFKYVNAEEFYIAYNKLNVQSKNELLKALEERYGLKYHRFTSLVNKDDVAVLKEIRKLYAKGKNNILNSPQNFFAKDELERIDRIINHIMESVKYAEAIKPVKIPIIQDQKKTKGSASSKPVKKNGKSANKKVKK